MKTFPTIDWFLSQPRGAVRKIHTELFDQIGGHFSVMPGWSDRVLPNLRHKTSGVEVVLVPGGSFMMGLSPHEEAAARRIENPLPFDPETLRPYHKEEVAPLLVSKWPVLMEQLAAWTNSHSSPSRIRRARDPAVVE